MTDRPAPPRAAQGTKHEGSTPFQTSLGLLLDYTAAGAVVEMDVRENLCGPAGSVEGGVISTIIDVAGGASAFAALKEFVATVDLTVHFLAPARVGPVRAEARTLRARNKLAVIEVRVTDVGNADRLCATGLVTMRGLGGLAN